LPAHPISFFKCAQIILDLCLWTALIKITGGVESYFFFGYPFEILVCSITLSTRGCIFAGLISACLYTSLVLISRSGNYLFDLTPKLLFLGAVSVLSTILIRKFTKINQEVTDLNDKLHAKVEASNEELKNILTSMSSGLIAVNETGEITEFNVAAEKITGLLRRDVIGKAVKKVLPSEGGIGHMLTTALEKTVQEDSINIELQVGETTKIIEVRPFVIGNGGDKKAAALLEDVTMLEEMREKIVRNKALSALGTMVSSIAHDLRNPLSGMKGFLSLMKKEKLEGTGQKSEFIELFEEGISSLNKTLDNMLLFSNAPKITRQNIDLRDLIDHVLMFLPPGLSRIRIEKDTGTDPVIIEADADLMKRCILNLILNAVDSMSSDGTIHISLRKSNGHAALSVKDTGAGIPLHIQDKIFTPFFSTKKNSTGLGLAIVKHLLELHGGDIKVRSEPGAGAEFTILLPEKTGITIVKSP
jgi:PAS domain S-box-containing protein